MKWILFLFILFTTLNSSGTKSVSISKKYSKEFTPNKVARGKLIFNNGKFLKGKSCKTCHNKYLSAKLERSSLKKLKNKFGPQIKTCIEKDNRSNTKLKSAHTKALVAYLLSSNRLPKKWILQFKE